MAWTFYNASGEAMIIDGGVQASAAVITNDLTVNSGNVVIGTAGKGIDFSAQTATATGSMAAEVLDHYEEGTWTPELWDSSAGAGESQGYGVQVGFFTRIGNRVFYNFNLQMSSLGSLTTGQSALIGGLPFTANAATNSHSGGNSIYHPQLNLGDGAHVTMFVSPNAASLNLYQSTATGADPVTVAEFSADGVLIATGQYLV